MSISVYVINSLSCLSVSSLMGHLKFPIIWNLHSLLKLILFLEALKIINSDV